jgi:serine/threonine protein kinase
LLLLCRPENFLFATPDADSPLKISDFGLSCFIEQQDSVITDACGSAYYIAPEIFSRRYTKAADVWALGVILYLLLSGERGDDCAGSPMV